MTTRLKCVVARLAQRKTAQDDAFEHRRHAADLEHKLTVAEAAISDECLKRAEREYFSVVHLLATSQRHARSVMLMLTYPCTPALCTLLLRSRAATAACTSGDAPLDGPRRRTAV